MSRFLAIDPSYSIGADFVNDTETYTGRWRRITILKGNTSFAALTAQNWTGNSILGESLPAGFTIEGVFTSFELDNGGAVIAYKI
jgi:tellurite resistance-related uncharacterized protein